MTAARVTCLGFAMLLGAAAPPVVAQAFDAPVNVSQSSNGSYLPSLTIDRAGPEAGTLRVFWHDFTSVPNLAWCSEGGAAGFGAGAACAFNVTRSWTPRAASGPAGVTHVAWRERTPAGEDDIFHARYDGIAWSTPVNVSTSAASSSNPALALDPWDRPHVVWEEASGGGVAYFESHFDGAAWSAPRDTGLPFAAADMLRLACDGAGVLHAAWPAGDPSSMEVLHAQRPDGGAWSAPQNLSSTPGSYSTEPSIATGPGDSVHVAWVEQDPRTGASSEICISSRSGGGAWAPWQPVTALGQDAYHPSLAVGADGVPRVAMGSGPPGGREVLYVPAPGASPVNVSLSPAVDSDRSALVLDDAGSPWIAWQEGSAPTPEIHVAGPAGSPVAPILLRVAREGADVVLTWTGGAAPWIASRSAAPDAPAPWPEITPAGGIRSPAWIDAGAVGDGVLRFYVID
jgi:hypothetical protein